MATDLPNELEAFRSFVNGQLDSGSVETVDELLKRYERYRRDLDRFQQDLQPSLDEADRGEAKSLDVASVEEEVTRKLAEKGITD